MAIIYWNREIRSKRLEDQPTTVEREAILDGGSNVMDQLNVSEAQKKERSGIGEKRKNISLPPLAPTSPKRLALSPVME